MTSPSTHFSIIFGLVLFAINAAAWGNPPGHVKIIMESDGAAYTGYVAPLILMDDGSTIATDRYNSHGFFGGKPGAWESIVPIGAPILGGGVITRFSSSTNSVPYHVNRSGQMVFVAESQIGATKTWGVFLKTVAGIYRLAYDGMAAPGGGFFVSSSGSHFGNVVVNHPPQISSNGLVLYFGETTGTGAPGDALYLVRLVSGTPVTQRVVAKGEVSPDGSLFTTIHPGFSGGWSVNSSGHVVFEASTAANYYDRYFYWDGVGISELPNGAQYNDEVMFNDAGSVLLARSAGMNGSTIGMSLGPIGGRTAIVDTTTAVPQGGQFGFDAIVNRPVLNDAGQVAFGADVNYGAPVSNGVWIWTGSAFATVATSGLAPGGGLLDDLDRVTPVFTNSGLVFFLAATNGGFTPNRRIFMSDGNQTVGLITEGDTLEGSQISKIELGISDTTVSNQQPANDAGQLVYRVELANGDEGLILYTPPARWWAGGSGNWEVPSNWAFFGFTPSPIRDVIIDPTTSAIVTGPASNATVRSLQIGGGSGTTRFESVLGAALATEAGTTVMPNGVLVAKGQIQGDLFMDGKQVLEADMDVQQLASVTYTNRSHLSVSLTDSTSVFNGVDASSLNVEAGAQLDVVLDGPGSTVDLTGPEWADLKHWTLIRTSASTGSFVVGTVTPDSLGLSVTPNVGSFSVVHTATSVDLVWKPKQFPPTVTAPGPQIAALNATISFDANGTGNLLDYRWTKNGKALAGQTASTLAFAAVKLTDAGNYTVTASNDAGSATSAPATRLGVVDVNLVPQVVATKGTLNLAVSAAAPSGLTFGYEWRLNGVLLVDGPCASGGTISGANSSRLRITKMTDAEEGNYTCTVFMDTLSIETNAAAVHVVMKPTVAVIAVPESRVSTPFNWQLVADEFPSGFVVTGLPSGLTYNRITGLVTGTPNVSGSFKVKVSARNPAGSGLIQEFTLTVSALPDGVAGAYSCLVGRDASVNGQLGGFLTLSVTNSGTFSGTLKNAALTHPLRGRVLASLTANPVATVSIVRRGQVPLALALEFDGSKNQVIGTLGDAVGVAGIDGRRHVWGGKTASGYATAYNCINELPLGSEADVLQPLGAAWQQMTIAAAGTVRGAGRTADGAAYTFSGTLWPDASLPQFVVLYAGKGSVTGLPRCALGSTLAENRISGWAEQFKSGPINSKDRTYSAGIPLLRRNVDGSPWVRPTKTAPIILEWPDVAVGSANANITFAQGGVEAAAQFSSLAQNFRITTRNAAVFAAATSGNPCKVRMTINPSTGVFSGAFNLSDTVSGKVLLRQGNFSGLFLSHQKKGFGYLLLPGLSPTVTTSPILSGRTEVSNSF